MDFCEQIPHCYFDLRQDEGHLSIMGAPFMWQLSNMFDPQDILRRGSAEVGEDFAFDPEEDDEGINMEQIAEEFEEDYL